MKKFKDIIITIASSYVIAMLILLSINFVSVKVWLKTNTINPITNDMSTKVTTAIDNLSQYPLSEDDQKCQQSLKQLLATVNAQTTSETMSISQFANKYMSSYTLNNTEENDNSTTLFWMSYATTATQCNLTDEEKSQYSRLALGTIVYPEGVILNQYKTLHEINLQDMYTRSVLVPTVSTIAFNSIIAVEDKIILDIVEEVGNHYEQ